MATRIRIGAALLLTGALLATAPRLARAQKSAAQGATVQVDVVNQVDVIKQSDLYFGIVLPGSGPKTLTKTDANIASFEIIADRGQALTITITPPATLTNGTDDIPYTCDAAYNENEDDPATATDLAGCSTFTMKPANQDPGQFLRAGYVYVFGTIDVGAVATGTYTGTVTVSAAY